MPALHPADVAPGLPVAVTVAAARHDAVQIEGRGVAQRVAQGDGVDQWRGGLHRDGAQGVVGEARWPGGVADRRGATTRCLEVQGDQVALGAMVQNRADVAQDVTVALRSQGLQLSDPLTQTLSVPPRGRAMVSWQAKAGDPGQARLTLRATSALAADALRREIPVRALAVPDQSITVGELARSAEQTVVLPVDAVAGQVTVRLERNLGGALLRGLEQLTGFPYGCVEQTMSKALPNAVVARAHSRLGLGQAGLPERLSAPITAGLQRLYGFQNEDGGWGWWADDGSDDSQTAWVVFGLGLTSEAGFAVDDAVVARGAERLTQRLAAMDARLRAFALYALALVKRGDEAAALKLAASPEPLDAFAQAALALALQRQGRNTEAEVLVDRLLAQIEAKDDQAWWPLAKGGGQPRMMPSAVRGTALGLSALLAIRPEDDHHAAWLQSQGPDRGRAVDRREVSPPMGNPGR